MNDESEFEEWINSQPVGLRATLTANPAFAVQRFKQQSRPVANAAAPLVPLVPTPPVVEPPLQEPELVPPQEVPAEGSKHTRRRSFWTSRRGDPTFHISRSSVKPAMEGRDLSKEERSLLKRRRYYALNDDGSVDIARDNVVGVSSSLFTECGDDGDSGESLVVEAVELRRRSQLLPAAPSKLEVNLVNGIQTLLSQNLIHMDPAFADRSLASYLHGSPLAIETVVPAAPPPPTPPPPIDEDSSDSDDDDVSPQTVQALRERAIAARSRLHVR